MEVSNKYIRLDGGTNQTVIGIWGFRDFPSSYTQ